MSYITIAIIIVIILIVIVTPVIPIILLMTTDHSTGESIIRRSPQASPAPPPPAPVELQPLPIGMPMASNPITIPAPITEVVAIHPPPPEVVAAPAPVTELVATPACKLQCIDMLDKAKIYYNTQSEMRGAYSMEPIATMEVDDTHCDIQYQYTPVGATGPVNVDQRRFTFQKTADCIWDVSSMGGHMSGIFFG
jgi:hypothetical protein